MITAGLVETAERIRTKKISPVELTEACLRRIEHANPRLNAFITVSTGSALAAARDAETEIGRGRWRGPLHGVPIALKDLIDTAGIRTTAASALYEHRVPPADAGIVRRLKAAGAVIVGKTNMQEFANGATSAVSRFGPVRNPWDTARIAGGSSGGSAAAVAAGLCLGAIGTDTAGSIRQPSAYCGIVGLKPTYGLVSARGVIPLAPTLDHVGPMARTVADAAILLQAIAGVDPLDEASTRISVPDFAALLDGDVESLRVGVARSFFFDGLDPVIEEAVNEALRVIASLTAGLVDVTLPAGEWEPARAAVRQAEAYAVHAENVDSHPDLYQPETLQRLRAGRDIDTVAYTEARRAVDRARRAAEGAFEVVDAIVTPTTPVPPPLLDDVTRDVKASMALSNRTIRNTAPFNVLGWPTISVPCGFTRAALPIGLQIATRPGDDATVLRLARAYERAAEWHRRRPPESAALRRDPGSSR